MLGQHQLGWPSHRPRLYSVGILKASSFGQLQNGLQQLKMLFCRPSIDCRSLFMAPKAGMFLANMLLFQLILPPSQTSLWPMTITEEEVEAERQRVAKAAGKASGSRFENAARPVDLTLRECFAA